MSEVRKVDSRKEKAHKLREQVLKTEQSLNALIYLYEKRYLPTPINK